MRLTFSHPLKIFGQFFVFVPSHHFSAVSFDGLGGSTLRHATNRTAPGYRVVEATSGESFRCAERKATMKESGFVMIPRPSEPGDSMIRHTMKCTVPG